MNHVNTYQSLKLKYCSRKVAESFKSLSQNKIKLMGEHCIKCSYSLSYHFPPDTT